MNPVELGVLILDKDDWLAPECGPGIGIGSGGNFDDDPFGYFYGDCMSSCYGNGMGWGFGDGSGWRMNGNGDRSRSL